MSKAILVLNKMPECCYDCIAYNKEFCKCKLKNKETPLEHRPNWCPLQYLLDPYDISEEPWEKDGYMGGWNDFRYEIVGDNDEFNQFGEKR